MEVHRSHAWAQRQRTSRRTAGKWDARVRAVVGAESWRTRARTCEVGDHLRPLRREDGAVGQPLKVRVDQLRRARDAERREGEVCRASREAEGEGVAGALDALHRHVLQTRVAAAHVGEQLVQRAHALERRRVRRRVEAPARE
eukprot:1142299-Pleurochrysis_carterae.AAC.1